MLEQLSLDNSAVLVRRTAWLSGAMLEQLSLDKSAVLVRRTAWLSGAMMPGHFHIKFSVALHVKHYSFYIKNATF